MKQVKANMACGCTVDMQVVMGTPMFDADSKHCYAPRLREMITKMAEQYEAFVPKDTSGHGPMFYSGVSMQAKQAAEHLREILAMLPAELPQ